MERVVVSAIYFIVFFSFSFPVDNRLSDHLKLCCTFFVQSVEVPLKSMMDTWWPPLTLTERVFCGSLWYRGKISTWTLGWIFFQVSRRFPYLLAAFSALFFLASLWVSISASEMVGVFIVAVVMLLGFR